MPLSEKMQERKEREEKRRTGMERRGVKRSRGEEEDRYGLRTRSE